MPHFFSDLRYALRTFARSPVFTTVALLSLALGIGANTAIFTLLDKVILRLLPIENPQELVLLTWRGSHYGSNTGMNALSYPLYKDFRDKNQVFSGMLCRYAFPLSVGARGQTERVSGELVSGNYFEVLGVRSAIGRTFTPDDDRTAGGHPLAVLSYDYWVNRFGADPGIIGQKLDVNGYPLTVIGVSEKGFDGVEVGYSPKIRIPVTMKKEMTGPWAQFYNLENRRGRWVNVFGRLKPGVTIEQAKASLQPLFHSILEMEVQQKEFANATAYTRQQFLKSTMDVLPAARGRSYFRQQYGTPLIVLMCIVGLVLVIACANVANLLLARAAGRQREMAVRAALGAGTGRIVRQTLVESAVLSLAGGAAGLLIAIWADHVLLSFINTGDSPLNFSTTPDLRVLAFTAGVSLLTGILFGLAPALQSARVDLASTLKEQAGAVAGGSHTGFRRALVVAQVFLSVLLLVGASLFIRSLQNLRNLDPGFRTHNILSFSVDPNLNGYSSERTRWFYRQLLERLRATAGVESAGMAIVRVIDGDEWDNTIAVEGYQAKPGEDMNPYYNAGTPGLFDTLGIPLVAGRDFTPADEASDHKVAVVNEKFVRYFFGNGTAIGRRFGFGGDPGTKTDIEIIGVIRDAKYQNMREEIHRQVFVPYFQQKKMDTALTTYVRTRVDPGQIATAIRRTVNELDSNMPIYSLRTLEQQMDRSLSTERLVATLASIFGSVATALAAIGLYGLMAYSVARRTREIGLRMALGAHAGNVTWLVMREVLMLVAAGTVIAIPTAWALSRYVRAQLYGISPNDPLSLLAAAGGLALVALLAGYVPARRATRIDPILALRYE